LTIEQQISHVGAQGAAKDSPGRVTSGRSSLRGVNHNSCDPREEEIFLIVADQERQPVDTDMVELASALVLADKFECAVARDWLTMEWASEVYRAMGSVAADQSRRPT
jgi:hypothetical protein